MTHADDPPETLARAARRLAAQEGVAPTLERIVDLAVEAVPGAEHAGVTALSRRQRLQTVAQTSGLPAGIDEAQYSLGEGPCVDAVWEQEVVHLSDAAQTERWPAFRARAVELGVRSMLSLRLFVDDDTAGALNLYASTPAAFGADDVRLGQAFAAHAALAWDHQRELEGLRAALEGRALVGQAQGVLMALHRITADEAFERLRSASQHANRKLRDVALDVVETGTLP